MLLSKSQLLLINKRIKNLSQEIQNFVLSDGDTMMDILEQDLDSYEIESLVGSYISQNIHPTGDITFPGNSSKAKPITIRIPENDLLYIKQKSFQYGMGYQTIINSLIRQYTTGKITLSLT